MTKPLADAWAKFNRAKFHSQGLARKIHAWIKAQGSRPIFTIELDEDARAGCLIIRVGRVKRLPSTWSLIAGDALFNHRASLDYLAWQLVQAGTEANTKKPELVMWPIIAKQADAKTTINLRLPGILPKHRALVEACQPYTGQLGKLNPLSVLNDLSRHDKHRKIAVLLAANKDYLIRGRVRYFSREKIKMPSPALSFPLKPGTETHADLWQAHRRSRTRDCGHAFRRHHGHSL